MKEINLPPFYIGQKVVCVDNSQWELFLVKDKEYIVLDNVFSKVGWQIGFEKDPKNRLFLKDNITPCKPFIYAKAIRFSPITENFQSISLEKVLETETKLVSAN